MKVTHLCSFDWGGGASKASSTLHRALRSQNVDQHMLVLRKDSNDPSVTEQNAPWGLEFLRRIGLAMDSNFVARYYKPWVRWSLGLAGNTSIVSHPLVQRADIISLSWVSGFLGIKAIARLLNSGKPVVWTLYDMWAFTGGCHYSSDCSKYTDSCGACPQLRKRRGPDLSRWVWNRKRKHWNMENLTVVCPSRWLADCARHSSIFHSADIRVIPTGIDTQLYYARDKQEARSALELPQDRSLLLFVASHGLANERKGGQLLERALLKISDMDLGCLPDLVVLGGGVSQEVESRFRVHHVSGYADKEIVTIYSACDVLVVSSKQDNLPLTMLEAMACQVPCVAFDIGGMPDAIDHKVNGYLAVPFDCDDLANGIVWILGDEAARVGLGKKALDIILGRFTSKQEANSYLQLFNEKLETGNLEIER